MRPIPIPDECIWEGAKRIVMAPPDGDLTNPLIAPLEMLADTSPSLGVTRFSACCMLEAGDLEKLAAGGHVWVTFYGAVIPFSVDVTEF